MSKDCVWCGGNTFDGYVCKICAGSRNDMLDDYFEDPTEVEDAINEPNHYARWPIEPITYIMRNGFEFWRGNIIKYASRAGYKGDEVEDLKKVIRYAEMRINQINGETKL